jgi:hypothetical protein
MDLAHHLGPAVTVGIAEEIEAASAPGDGGKEVSIGRHSDVPDRADAVGHDGGAEAGRQDESAIAGEALGGGALPGVGGEPGEEGRGGQERGGGE